MTEELKPCPWCGCDDIVETDEEFERDYLYCNDCGAMRVKKYWNERASPWVRVEDGLPPDDREVYINFAEWNAPHKKPQWEVKKVARYHKGIGSEWSILDYSQQGDYSRVTHWMPIPPIGEENEK